jgi:hypothetical protein
MDQMRIELEERFNGKQITVKSFDLTEIDTMFIPALTAQGHFEDLPTMMYCNPNAGYYEFTHYQSEWMDYYISMGVNVILWNYRSYGRSKGRATPK